MLKFFMLGHSLEKGRSKTIWLLLDYLLWERERWEHLDF